MAGDIANLAAAAPLMRDDYKGSKGPKKSKRAGKKSSKKKSGKPAKAKKSYAPSPIAAAMGAPC